MIVLLLLRATYVPLSDACVACVQKNAALEFVRLVKVRHQLVAGTMYYFTVEVREINSGAYKLYEAKVWLREWENFKGLHAFEPVVN